MGQSGEGVAIRSFVVVLLWCAPPLQFFVVVLHFVSALAQTHASLFADILNTVSRSFSIVIQQLGPELRDAVSTINNAIIHYHNA